MGQLIALERFLTQRQNDLQNLGISPPFSPSIHPTATPSNNPLQLSREQQSIFLEQLDDIEEELESLHQQTADFRGKVNTPLTSGHGSL